MSAVLEKGLFRKEKSKTLGFPCKHVLCAFSAVCAIGACRLDAKEATARAVDTSRSGSDRRGCREMCIRVFSGVRIPLLCAQCKEGHRLYQTAQIGYLCPNPFKH